MLVQAITKNAVSLAIFAVVTTGAISATYLGTKQRIADVERQAQAKALTEIISADQHDNSLLDDTVMIDDKKLLGLHHPSQAFIARKDGQFVAAIIPAIAPDGYSGDIQIITGILADGTIAGVRVLVSHETPGLGDKADRKKSNWVDEFIGRSLTNPSLAGWAVKKDKGVFDQFTGATITPRAITNVVKRTLIYFKANRDKFTQAAATRQENP